MIDEHAGRDVSLDDLRAAFSDGTTRRETVEIRSRQARLALAVPAPIIAVDLDPHRDVLLWRVAYEDAPRVNDVPLTARAPWVDDAVYEGTYEVALLEMSVEVYGDEKGLWARAGEELYQLWAHRPHRFRTEAGWVEFRIEDGWATSFVLELESSDTAEGVRMQ